MGEGDLGRCCAAGRIGDLPAVAELGHSAIERGADDEVGARAAAGVLLLDEELLADMDRDTVDMRLTFDEENLADIFMRRRKS